MPSPIRVLTPITSTEEPMPVQLDSASLVSAPGRLSPFRNTRLTRKITRYGSKND